MLRKVARERFQGSFTAGMAFVRRVVLGLVLLFGAVACARKDAGAPNAGNANQPAPLRKVVLQSDWFPQAEHGGFYQALAKGYYRAVGLDVEILPGGPGAGIKLKVARGDADFGMLKSDDIIMAASRGMPLVMVMATMQHDPQALMVHDSSPVKSFRDLNGRTITAAPGMTWIPYIQKKYGITFNLAAHNYGIATFLADPETIQQCVVTNEPFLAQQHGKAVRTLALAAAGYDCYPVIFARREFLRSSPQVARAFVTASIRGWRDYLDREPAPAHDVILARNKQMTPELLRYSRDQLIARSLVRGDASKDEDVGQLSITRLAEEMQTLLELKVLDSPIAISAVATKEFLPTRPQ